MALVKVKPTSAGRRSLVKVVNPDLYKGRPVESLTESQECGLGRNKNGRSTMRRSSHSRAPWPNSSKVRSGLGRRRKPRATG